MMKTHRIDHVSVIVLDLAAAKEFFIDLGLEVLGETEVQGEWVDRIIGLSNARSKIAMLGVPGAQTNIELVQFITPLDPNGIQPCAANTLGIRHIAFAVEDIDSIVAKLKAKGREVFNDVENYKGFYKLCYVRGPEGIILELAEELGGMV